MKVFITLVALMAANTVMAGEDLASDGNTQAMASPGANKQWDITLGLQARISPDYLGSAEKSALPLPMVRISYASDLGTLRLGTLAGAQAPMLSFSPVETSDMTLGIGIGIDQGRSEVDAKPFNPGSARLKGMGDVDSTGVVALFGRYRMADFTVHGLLRSAIDADRGHGGQLGYLGASYALPLRGPLSASVSASMTWASERYMQNMFGVAAAQSSNSGFPVYRPGSGIRDISLEMDLRYRLDQQLFLHGGAGVMRLVGDAAASPLVESDLQPRVHVGVTYHW
jgi:outer membrane protein